MPKDILIRIGIIVACVAFFSFKVGDVGTQFTGDENFYFESSKGMLQSGDWLTPRYYGKPRFQKPILYYWLVASSFSAFGINWHAARLPSILFGAFTVLLVYLIGAMVFKKRGPSLFCALMLAATFKFFKYARFAIPDMALLFFITLSMYIFLKIAFERRGDRGLSSLFFLAIGLGFLTKGPVAFIIPFLSIGLFLIISKSPMPIKKGDIFIGGLLCAAIALPWFLAMWRLHGSAFTSHLWTREISERVGSRHGATDIFFYIPIVLVRFLPWSIFLPMGAANCVRAARPNAPGRDGYIFILSWFVCVFIFFTLMGEKHSQYMLSLTAPFALIVGGGLSLGRLFSKKWISIPVVTLLVTVVSFVSVLSSNNLRLNSDVLGAFAAKAAEYGLEESDKVGAGSHELIPQQLEVYLDRPVEKVGARLSDPAESDRANKIKLENFFKSGKVYCVISE
ncbi:MAG: glycosyltransferase family 39 protein, partial [Candidatus Omnitrophota bacterium]